MHSVRREGAKALQFGNCMVVLPEKRMIVG